MSNIHPVDALGALKAQIAELETQAKAVHAKIVAMGIGAHEGNLFRATVSVAERTVFDNAAIRARCSKQLVTAHTSYTEVTTVRVVSRIGDAA